MPENPIADRRLAFRALHERGCFVIPNPWDAGSARYLRHLGFPALATTSAGWAFSLGHQDSARAVPLASVLRNIAEIVEAVDVPVNADFESGYAADPETLAANVRLCIETGVAGLSIEDATADRSKPLYDIPLAVERLRAAREAIDSSGTGVLLTARSAISSVIPNRSRKRSAACAHTPRREQMCCMRRDRAPVTTSRRSCQPPVQSRSTF
jgi:2-methylisocitrate lyase-like PEP mutase family enzyme